MAVTTPAIPAGSPLPPVSDAPEIGYKEVPAAVLEAARVAQSRALRDHKARRWEAARRGFDAAARLAPGHAMTRYNLACATARTGDLKGAEAILRDLFMLDLPQFRGRFEQDEDLASVRAGAEGQSLRKLAAELEGRWRELAKDGVPAVLWRAAGDGDGAYVSGFYRQGVYQVKARRFLPLGAAPKTTRMLGSLLDVAREEVVLVEGNVVNCLVDFCPRLGDIRVERRPLWGEGRATATWQWSGEDYNKHTIDVGLAGDGFVVRTVSTGDRWRQVLPDGQARSTTQAAPSGLTISIRAAGTTPSRDTAGYQVKSHALVLPDGSKIAIDRGHWVGMSHAVTVAQDSSYAVVSSMVSECECGPREGPLLQHAASRVDLRSKTSALLSRGGSSGTATIGRDGSVFLQVGAKTFRVPDSGKSSAREALPEGVLLVPPADEPSNCCGL
ncbi:MAG: hypothetical protein R3B70_40100 [Polyangiaceae bacterium]